MESYGSSPMSTFKARYPMYVIPVKKLMQMKKFLIHREMLERNLVQEYTAETEGRVIVVSHQWLSYHHPDPDQEHFFTLKRVLDRLGNGEVNRVEDYWLHTMMFRSTGITAQEWKNDFDNTYVWIDYCCIPQVEVDMDPRAIALSSLAVQSISAYVERASLLLVLAPICVHKETRGSCNFATWRTRGWCRLEMMSAILSTREVRVMVCTGAEATPFLLHPFEAPRMPVGHGEFSCCELGHTMGGHTIACDKQRIRGAMEEMLQAKVQSFKLDGKVPEKMWFACMQTFFLKGLPEKEVSFSIPESVSLFPDEEEDVEKLHHFLRQRFNTTRGLDPLKRLLAWTDSDKKRMDASGFTLMMCAAIADNADAVHELAATDTTGALVNQGLKRHFFHLSWETVQALLDNGADPKAQAQNGMDAFFFACCLGNLENIKGWLKSFPKWDMDRTIPLVGMSPLCAAVCSGAKKEHVLKVLIEAQANLTQKARWGGESSLLCMLANNEDSQCPALQLLLDQGCNVNASWTAHTTFFAGALKVVRMGSKMLPDRPLAELAVLQGSTPLHFAAKRGDVEMVRQLISAKADVHCRNKEGRRPIDVARSFFGGQVPQPLAEALLADATDTGDSEEETMLHFVPHGVRHMRHFRVKEKPGMSSMSSIESEGSTASSERRPTLISL